MEGLVGVHNCMTQWPINLAGRKHTQILIGIFHNLTLEGGLAAGVMGGPGGCRHKKLSL